MKVCIVVEGCYPYVVGGVSSWVHSLIQQYPKTEFIVQTIIANRELSGTFVYELPENVIAVDEIYLEDFDWVGSGKQRKKNRTHLSEQEYAGLRSLVIGEKIQWPEVFAVFENRDFSINDLLMGNDFLEIVKEFYSLKYANMNFSDFLWSMRSMYLPFCYTLKTRPPEADLYHCVATGYAGIWGSMAKAIYQKPLLISEHGIYTREREEELIKANWVKGLYKNLWIEQFYKMSSCAYAYADQVTSLFEKARKLQIELGCPQEKTIVTPNGINVEQFADIPQKEEEDPFFNIGAVLRVTPIKDVKTMIYAFYFAKKRRPQMKLWIMGPCEENQEYADECFELVRELQVKDVVFTGRIQVKEYLGKMDVTILTSISEGQPLTILEGYAAKKPAIATNVGDCEGLIYGETDNYGDAGIVVPVMSLERIADAMVWMADHPVERKQMGEIGYRRACEKYTISDMRETYHGLYKELAEAYGAELLD